MTLLFLCSGVFVLWCFCAFVFLCYSDDFDDFYVFDDFEDFNDFVDFDGFISIFMETVLELTNVVFFLCFSFSFPEKGMKCGHF